MRKETRKKYTAMRKELARVHDVDSVQQQFTVAPLREQRLQDAIVEQSTFLPKINVITVDDMEGENILGFASGPVTGRTDTTQENHERIPRNVLGMKPYRYKLAPTNSDVFIPYRTLDAWAKFPDLGARYTRYVQERIANDRELIGWHGRSAAAESDLAKNPLMQDVNKGWMQYLRENNPSNILNEAQDGSGVIRIGPGGDYANLDMLGNDLLQGIPLYKRKELVVHVGDELIAHERAALYAAVGGKPTEKNAMNMAMATIAGLNWETPSNFPSRGFAITGHKNLSIYVQSGTWRRNLKDKPEKDRVEDFNSRNEGFVVEDVEAMVAVEWDHVQLPDAKGTFA